MKYMLDIILIIGMLWVGYLWNAEKKIGLEISDDMAALKAQKAQLQLDHKKASEERDACAQSQETLQQRLDETGKELLTRTDELTAKTQEADQAKTDLVAAVARVKKLEGYKAKAIVAEMPKPIQKAVP
jgi:DNA repair exonuclease SbcCD ATPase subunit